LVAESLAVPAPENLGAARLELRLSLTFAADGAALTGLLAGALSFDRVGLLVLGGADLGAVVRDHRRNVGCLAQAAHGRLSAPERANNELELDANDRAFYVVEGFRLGTTL
jgi:hypothetical protein